MSVPLAGSEDLAVSPPSRPALPRWSHVVPARQARERHRAGAGGEGAGEVHEVLEQFRPEANIPQAEALRARSKAIARAAPATFFPPRPPS